MAIIRFDPFYTNSWLKPFFSDDEDNFPTLTMTEGLNVYEEDGNVVVEASLPGVPEDKIDVTYEDGLLRVSGRYEEKDEQKKKNRVVHRMQRISSFDYTTYLPKAINESKINAEVKNGVIKITAPVAETVKPKKISVKIAK